MNNRAAWATVGGHVPDHPQPGSFRAVPTAPTANDSSGQCSMILLGRNPTKNAVSHEIRPADTRHPVPNPVCSTRSRVRGRVYTDLPNLGSTALQRELVRVVGRQGFSHPKSQMHNQSEPLVHAFPSIPGSEGRHPERGRAGCA